MNSLPRLILGSRLMIGNIGSIICAFLACLITHEGGHYLAALCFGRKIAFSFRWEKSILMIYIPRYTWRMPTGLQAWQKAIVALAGFATEIGVATALFVLNRVYAIDSFFMAVFLNIALVRLVFYEFYAGEASDFKKRW